jgi:predicted peroxiredoxin
VKHTSIAAFDFIVQVEDAIQNGVKDTAPAFAKLDTYVEDIIQNGVKKSYAYYFENDINVEDTIQNGVKHTSLKRLDPSYRVEDAIKNGVKEVKEVSELSLVSEIFKVNSKRVIQKGVKKTDFNMYRDNNAVEDAIQNGVKHTEVDEHKIISDIEDVIQNGVKEIRGLDTDELSYHDVLGEINNVIQDGVKNVFIRPSIAPSRVEDTIKNGVKISKPMEEWVNTERIIDKVVKYGVKKIKTPGEDGDLLGFLDFMLDNNTDSVPQLIDDVIINGVKETQPLPAQDGNMDWGNYYHGKEDRTKPFNEYLDEAIRFGVKETYDDCSDNIARVERIIRVGKKID